MSTLPMESWPIANAPTSELLVTPFNIEPTFKTRVYDTLKQAIIALEIYGKPDETWLDERQLAERLGVSRTPIREAIAMLEQQGFVKSVPRRGINVLRKSKREVIETIQVWAALEAMAARLVIQNSSDEEIRLLRQIFNSFHDTHRPVDYLSEYSVANIRFHQTIIELTGSSVLRRTTEDILMHVRGIRCLTIGRGDRASRSIEDHLAIIAAIEERDIEEAERLCRNHTLGLADYVESHSDGIFY